MNAAVVETLKVGRPPPVPAVSSRSSRRVRTGVASARIVRRQADELLDGLPLRAQADEEAGHLRLGDVAAHHLARARWPSRRAVRSWPEATASIALVRIGLGTRRRRGAAARGSCAAARLPSLGEDRLGVELHALGGQLAVADPHDHAAALGAALQAVGQVGIDDERVVAAHDEGGFKLAEDGPAVVLDRRGLAVHRLVAHDAPAEGLRHRLVAEADAERRDAAPRGSGAPPRGRCRPRWACTGPGEITTRS